MASALAGSAFWFGSSKNRSFSSVNWSRGMYDTTKYVSSLLILLSFVRSFGLML